MIKNLKNVRGFSLIELLVTIVIIGILSTAAVSYFSGATKKARDGVRKSTASQIGATLMGNFLTDANFGLLTATNGEAYLLADFSAVPSDSSAYRYVFTGSKTSLAYAACFWSESASPAGMECVGPLATTLPTGINNICVGGTTVGCYNANYITLTIDGAGAVLLTTS